MDGFTVVAEPTRRAIVDRLRVAPRDVSSLVEDLRIPQPLASKHLKVLRDAGVVTADVAGRRRVYRLAADPLPDVLAWIRPYYDLWSASLDALERALDEDATRPSTKERP